MTDTAYSGWEGFGNRASAYATWRVALEMLDDDDYWHETYDEKPDEDNLADAMKEYVEEVVFADDPNQEQVRSWYAAAFLEDVNWREIAENTLLDWPDDEDDS